MALPMSRIRWIWSGGSGLPGVSTFYVHAGDEEVNVNLLGTFFTACANAIPNNVTIAHPGSGETLDAETGELVDGYVSPSYSVGGGTGTNYFAGVGGYINWNTTAVIGGRTIRGRTFLAPLTAINADVDGTLGSGTVDTINGALHDLYTHVDFSLCVWHRPRSGSGGTMHPIVSAVLPDRVTALRSRRR